MNRSVARTPRRRPAKREPQTRRRSGILDAAELLFSRNGVRGVSMERIAAEAGVAKATLYSYFSDRDAVFVAVADRVAERLVAGVAAALAEAGSPEERAARALAWKHNLVHELTGGSGHAQELLGARDRLARVRFERADAEMVEALGGALAADRALAPRARALARALFFGTQGLAEHRERETPLDEEIETFARILLRGARATSSRGRPSGRTAKGGRK
jgi:AcrR family transcriptional regulator